MKRKEEYPELARKPLKLLVPFSYLFVLFNGGFKKLKREIDSQLENDLIICVSKIEPRFEIFFKNKQAQPSH
jgi:hypothetical protein